MTEPDLRIAVLVEQGFQELEFWYPVLRFREDGHQVTVVGPDRDATYKSRLGYPVIPDVAPVEVTAEDFQVVVVPGGDAADRIAANAGMLDLVRRAAASGAVTAALSSGRVVLEAAGLLEPTSADTEHTAGVVRTKRIVTASNVDDLPNLIRTITEALEIAGASVTGN